MDKQEHPRMVLVREIVDLTMKIRAEEYGTRYNDFDRKIIYRHAQPYLNSKDEKLIAALERGFMEIEGTTKPW